MPDEEPVVWPDDPVEGDSSAAEAPPANPGEPAWPTTFEDALKQSQAASEHPAAPVPAPAAIAEPAAAEPVHEYPTQPSMPAIAAKTEPAAPAEAAKTAPPEPASQEESAPVLGTADELPTSTFKTPIPAPVEVSASNGAEAPPLEAAQAEPAAEPAPVNAEPVAEAASAPEAEPEPVNAAEPEPEAEPVKAPEPEPEPRPVKEPEPAPEPVKAAEPEPAKPAEPEAASKEEEWVPLPANPPIPAWAPKLGEVAAAGGQNVDWGASNPLPAWAPIGGGRSTSNMPAATRISSTPATPAASQPPQPAAPAPAPTAASQPPAAAARASQPPAADASKPKTSSWEIVQPKDEKPKQAYAGPTAEDKSYAEWFAWAKRSGAPAGACHAAAQGAFRALSAGHDMNTAVQWATLAMASPPGLVSASRQLYCAWYSLGNIDLKLPSPQAHAFATGAIAALESGADAPSAHQAGLAAAGITG